MSFTPRTPGRRSTPTGSARKTARAASSKSSKSSAPAAPSRRSATPRTARSSASQATTAQARSASARRTSTLRTNTSGNQPRAPRNSRASRSPRRKRPLWQWLLIALGSLIAAGLLAGIAAFSYLWITTDIPPAEKVALAQKTTVTFSDGTTKIGSFGDQNREIIDCSVLPKYVGDAVVASENRSFYTDRGIDLKGIARALVNNLSGKPRQGGSTITQQYAERYYMGSNTSYIAKAREAVMALKIAQSQDKSEVLCNYMNTIYLGRGAYGIQAAAKAYFGKEAKDLTVSEAALLAGIIPAPSAWDPADNPKQAKARFTRVIDIMAEDGYITADEKTSAAMPDTIAVTQTNDYQGPNGYLLQMARQELLESKAFTKDELDTGGYTIVTTIDKDKQDLMFQTASKTGGTNQIKPDGVEIGGISVNVKDGSIISLYAGDDYLTKQLNNVTDAQYEPGSTMKPFTLLAAVQDGVSLNTVFNGNSPRDFEGLSTPMTNSGNVSYGYINLYSATANSVNTVFMDLQEHLGAKRVADTARTAGVTGDIVEDAYTTLGNSGLTVKAMASGFATLANQGNKPTLHIVAHVYDDSKQELYQAPTTTERVFEANDVNLVVNAMQGTVRSGSAREASSIGKAIAGKTGTANDAKANSFVGFTPSTLTLFATWNPDPQTGAALEMPNIGSYGVYSGYSVHLFTQYMKQALADTPNEQFPTATDNGVVGGQDGTWGTGSRRWYSESNKSDEPKESGNSNDSNKQGTTPTKPDNSGNTGDTTGQGGGDGNNAGTGAGADGTTGAANGTAQGGVGGNTGSSDGNNPGGTDGGTTGGTGETGGQTGTTTQPTTKQ